jgi:hypothetical protein
LLNALQAFSKKNDKCWTWTGITWVWLKNEAQKSEFVEMIESQGIWRVIIANEETRLSSASLFFTYLNILIDILSQNCHCWAYLIFIKDKNRTTESKSR